MLEARHPPTASVLSASDAMRQDSEKRCVPRYLSPLTLATTRKCGEIRNSLELGQESFFANIAATPP